MPARDICGHFLRYRSGVEVADHVDNVDVHQNLLQNTFRYIHDAKQALTMSAILQAALVGRDQIL